MAEVIAVIVSVAVIGIFILHGLYTAIRRAIAEKEQTRRFMEDEMFLRYNELEAYCAMLRKAALSDDFNPKNKK